MGGWMGKDRQENSKGQNLCLVVVKGELDRGDEKEKKIRELTAELESTNQRCEVYRANLLAVLRDMEEQKLKLSVKVQNARLRSDTAVVRIRVSATPCIQELGVAQKA
ncbi:hypothetical protein RCOM_1564160 [Ricinus communis]|uniref:Uncharacterized protein n=1 Tax=Ricinus communis TaxID=3988 RepID=B9RKX7_RICCO|nr:hypothetical protein RCOM_1564160 [Ricinus communis]